MITKTAGLFNSGAVYESGKKCFEQRREKWEILVCNLFEFRAKIRDKS